MNRVVHASVALALMAVSSAGAVLLRPTDLLAKSRSTRVDLESQVPKAFGDWKLDAADGVGVVDNPQVQEMLDRIYTQLLTRTYVDSQGDRVMFVIAYGADQRRRSGLNLHQPEICYPAQGFEIRSLKISTLPVGDSALPVKRLETVLEDRRYEPVTYWTMTGDFPNVGGLAKRKIDFRYGLQRIVPDGMLIRVSSIGRDTGAQFALQDRFIRELLADVAPATRAELAGELRPVASS